MDGQSKIRNYILIQVVLSKKKLAHKSCSFFTVFEIRVRLFQNIFNRRQVLKLIIK